ncbi:OmpA/MotB family protein [Desulfatitalea tepidiphila]|uniref:OmpA/MotB family protein n=1 Tax=Desulfatitalea tepidiphila TaxID=1185843 RepID=UPI0006B59EF0|nr:flagellar motor protein MotB [Desulfatitalea tepidiphila]
MAARFPKAGLQHPAAGQAREGWQIVYTGFILIMLCFFIMLTSFASLDPSRITRFVNSFNHAVNVLSGGQNIEEGDAIVDEQVNLLAREDLRAKLFESVHQAARDEGMTHIEISQVPTGVVLRLKEKLLFDSGEAVLTEEAREQLDPVGRIIQRIGAPVEIQGHTDDRPIRGGRFPSNWELSTARAISVLRFLSASDGVESRLLSAVGYAEFNPLADNSTDEGRATNRRVDVVFQMEIE